MTGGAGLSVDELLDVLATGADCPLGPGAGVSQLDHALQTGGLLRRLDPDDLELAVAGLVHDVGQLLPGGRDGTHAEDAAAAVRQVLGERVAGMVGLHVEAKRYLVAVEGGYGGVLAADSVRSLTLQGGAMGTDEVAAFSALPHAGDAVRLRRADDSGKDEVGGLELASRSGSAVLRSWAEVLRQCEREHGRRAHGSGARPSV